MLPDLRIFSGTMGTPLLGGDRGVSQTIDLMRKLVDDAVKDPVVNRAAIEMVRGVADAFNRQEKAQRLYSEMAARWTYVEDPVGPFGPKETLRPVRALLSLMAGDCDDATLLISSLLGTIGIRSRFITVAADPSAPDEFSHIYPEAEIYPDVWVAMDIARPGSAYGLAPKRYFRKRAWNFEYDQSVDLMGDRMGKLRGCGCGGSCCGGKAKSSRLSGYAVLGDAAADIAAVGQSAADVIAAADTNPYAYYGTAYSPGLVAPPAGYSVYGTPLPAASLTATATPGIATMLAIGVGLLLLLRAHH